MTNTTDKKSTSRKQWPFPSPVKSAGILDSFEQETYQPINAYGLVGNCHSAVLIGPDGSVDWGCFPDFDSPALFCRLLDSTQGGYFQIAPVDTAIPGVQCYLPRSNVLQTRFSSLAGEIVLTDFMPVQTLDGQPQEPGPSHTHHGLIRRLVCSHGQLPVRMALKATPHYAAALNDIVFTPTETGVIISGGQQHTVLFIRGAKCMPSFTLQVEWPANKAHPVIVAQWTLSKGEEVFFALEVAENTQAAHELIEQQLPRRNFAAELTHTVNCWRDWLARCTYTGPYLAEVQRSALTLKMMTFAPTGALVAAPTTSLPEALGEGRNWDYRYTWLRDASFTLAALSRLGFTAETHAFTQWLCGLTWAKHEGPQIMYGIRGEHDLPEYELGHLSGYCESAPVRIGNGAARQKQLDVFGEVLDCIFLSQQPGTTAFSQHAFSQQLWKRLSALVEHVCAHWHETDSGIWEVRGEPRHYVYSKVMCWVAVDRGIRIAEQFEAQADLPRWQLVRDQIRLDVLTHGYNAQLEAFTQAYDSTALDASCLFLPLVGFLSADDPRMRSTVERVMEELTDQHGFVYRYHADDGLTGREGTFLMCTFWLIDNLALQGRLTEARSLFEQALRCTGKVGLFSEEIDPLHQRALGNYPQAFSHLALIHSALNLQHAEMRLARSQPATSGAAALMLDG